MTRRFRYAQGSPNMANLLLIDDDPDLLADQIAHVFPSLVFAGPPQIGRMSLSRTCACPTSPAWFSMGW
jgi:hypothetical protein